MPRTATAVARHTLAAAKFDGERALAREEALLAELENRTLRSFAAVRPHEAALLPAQKDRFEVKYQGLDGKYKMFTVTRADLLNFAYGVLDGFTGGYLGKALDLLDIESEIIDESNPYYTAGFVVGMKKKRGQRKNGDRKKKRGQVQLIFL